MCARNSEGVTRTIDIVNERIEDARQTDVASTLRASIADLQVVFVQMKTQFADCVALAGEGGGGAMGNTPGLDHSKTGAASAKGNPAEPSEMAGMDHSRIAGEKAAPAVAVGFTVRTDPAPPRNGKNDFEVTVKDASLDPTDEPTNDPNAQRGTRLHYLIRSLPAGGSVL